MQIFNTLTQQKEEFKPIVPGKIKMYVCGPTVYNYIHIGNARSVVAFDTIRRYFEYRGYQVDYVSNFTDVDDKMINQARKDGITVPQLADKYMDQPCITIFTSAMLVVQSPLTQLDDTLNIKAIK